MVIDDLDDFLAVFNEPGLNLVLVVRKCLAKFLVFGVLFDGRNGSAGSALATDEVLEGDRDQVALIYGDVTTLLLEHLAQVIDHVFESLSLLCDSCEENVRFRVSHK